MKLLLDTHIWIWASLSPEKLSRKVQRELSRPSNEQYVSPVSIWEARLLERRGRFRLRPTFDRWVSDALAPPILEAPFTFQVGMIAGGVNLPQSDPGDVFVAATALTYDLTLVTADEQLLACSWLKTLANE